MKFLINIIGIKIIQMFIFTHIGCGSLYVLRTNGDEHKTSFTTVKKKLMHPVMLVTSVL